MLKCVAKQATPVIAAPNTPNTVRLSELTQSGKRAAMAFNS